MKPIQLLITLLLFCILAACSKTELPKAELGFGFIQYANTEIDSVVFTRYAKGSNFTQIIDSILLIDGSSTLLKSGDTARMTPVDGSYRIKDDYDFEVRNLFDQKKIRISNITYSIIKVKRKSFTSSGDGFSPIEGYVRDGVLITVNNPDKLKEEFVYLIK